ncbi:MAG: hypothetical protein KF819_04845 [Labilithrix sp.]|nr:hypothetical protein [Labilithrix sp.]
MSRDTKDFDLEGMSFADAPPPPMAEPPRVEALPGARWWHTFDRWLAAPADEEFVLA